MWSCDLGALRGEATLLEMDQQQRDCRRRHARHPAGLPDRRRPILREAAAHLMRESRHQAVIDVVRQSRLLVAALALDLLALALDVPGVLRSRLDLYANLRGNTVIGRGAQPGRTSYNVEQCLVADFRAAEQLERRR